MSERTMTLSVLLADLAAPPVDPMVAPTGFRYTLARPLCFLLGHRLIHDANIEIGQLVRTSYCRRCGNITVKKFL